MVRVMLSKPIGSGGISFTLRSSLPFVTYTTNRQTAAQWVGVQNMNNINVIKMDASKYADLCSNHFLLPTLLVVLLYHTFSICKQTKKINPLMCYLVFVIRFKPDLKLC